MKRNKLVVTYLKFNGGDRQEKKKSFYGNSKNEALHKMFQEGWVHLTYYYKQKQNIKDKETLIEQMLKSGFRECGFGGYGNIDFDIRIYTIEYAGNIIYNSFQCE